MKRISRRESFVAAAALAMGTALAGCGRTAPAGPDAQKAGAPVTPVTLNVVTWPGLADMTAYKKMGEEFGAAKRGITIQVDETPLPQGQDQEAKLKYLLAAGQAPDLAQTQMATALLFAKLQSLRVLDPLLAVSKVTPSALFAPVLEPATKLGGKTVNIPIDTLAFVVWVNKDRFAEASVPLPKPNWTWDDLAETARRLTKGSGDDRKWGFQADMFWSRFEPWIYQSGGKPFDHVNFPTRSLLDQKEPIAAVEVLQDMTTKHQSMISPQLKAEWARANAYNFPWRRGAVTMEFGHSGGLRTFPKEMSFKYDPLPLPRKAKAATTFVTDALVIFSSSKHVEAAWEFVRFAASQAGQKYVVSEASRMPPRKELAVKLFLPFAKQEGGVGNPQPFADAFDYGIPQTNTPAIFRIQNEWLVPTWARMMDKGESVRDHMTEGARFINQVLKEIG